MQELLDITPNPRILRTLGDIPFAPWQCIAELVDNALDAFKNSAYEQPSSTDQRIIVSWSSDSVAAADRQLEVADTGPGIDLSIIQDSVRAGYTSNNTFSTLGLFGMGFNIATALCWLLSTSVLKRGCINSRSIGNFEPILKGLRLGTGYVAKNRWKTQWTGRNAARSA